MHLYKAYSSNSAVGSSPVSGLEGDLFQRALARASTIDRGRNREK